MTNPIVGELRDSFGRRHNNLRISVTDRCNVRCFYCMPKDNVVFKPRSEILSLEEIERVARVAASLGVNRLRLTGGEPLVRAKLSLLVKRLAQIDGIQDIALTTNGILLADYAQELKQAGLGRLNISLDGMSESTFQRITRRKGLQRVLDGISAAKQAGFDQIRLNAVAIKGLTEHEIVPLVEYTRENDLELRFIEFMPLDAEENWHSESVASGDEIRAEIERRFGPLTPTDRPDPSQPAVDYRFPDGVGSVGFINSVSQPFCDACNRLRITAEGQFRNCLFSTSEWDARAVIREGGSDADVAKLIRECVAAKKTAHGHDEPDFARPDRPMYQIGG